MEFKTAHTLEDKERTEDISIEENVSFDELYLSDAVLSGLTSCGFVRPSPIQLSAIPLGRCGLDLIVQAKSGTGKTCVFSVVALEMISVIAKTTQVLVVAPTREIAVQIGQVVNSIGSAMPDLRASTFIGGINILDDKAKLKCCHIAIGTPGRLIQLVSLGNLNLKNVRLLVLDEADQLLTGQFKSSILELVKSLPLNKQVLALSATYPQEITDFLDKFMRSPSHVRLGKESPALLGVCQFVRLLPDHPQPHKRHKIKFNELLSILSTVSFNQCLVFSNSQLRAESICNQLKSSGWPASFLTGGQMQEDRLQAFFALCSYKCRILVSTDLSARGLDSEHVNLVINLDVPSDQATYLHRVGRAGRYGSKGMAISLVCEGEEWESMRAVATLTNVQVKILQDNYDCNSFESEDNNLELIEYMDEADCSLWLAKVNKKKGRNMSSNEKRENIISHKTKLSDKSALLAEEIVTNKLMINKDCAKHVQLESSCHTLKKESLMCSEGDKNTKLVRSVLKDFSKQPKLHSFSYADVVDEIQEKWENISKYDTPNLVQTKCLNEYPPNTLFNSLESHLSKREVEASYLMDTEYIETETTSNPVEALQSFIQISQSNDNPMSGMDVSNHSNGCQPLMIELKENLPTSKDSDLYIGNEMKEKEGSDTHIMQNDLANKSNINIIESDTNERKECSPVTKSNIGKKDSEIEPLASVVEDFKVEVKNKVKTSPKKYCENTGFGEWKVVSSKPEPKYKVSSSKNSTKGCEKKSKTKHSSSHSNHENHFYKPKKTTHSPANDHCSQSTVDENENNPPYSTPISNQLYASSDQYCTSIDMYIQSAQKFGMMMEYVQSLGRMSSWIAQDFNNKMLKNNQLEKQSHKSQRREKNGIRK